MLEIRAAAFASFFALHASTTTSSTYQPSIAGAPVHAEVEAQPDRVAGLDTERGQVDCDWPHEPVDLRRRPCRVKAGWPASGFVLPAAAVASVALYGLK